jgi:hypothetical protein
MPVSAPFLGLVAIAAVVEVGTARIIRMATTRHPGGRAQAQQHQGDAFHLSTHFQGDDQWSSSGNIGKTATALEFGTSCQCVRQRFPG